MPVAGPPLVQPRVGSSDTHTGGPGRHPAADHPRRGAGGVGRPVLATRCAIRERAADQPRQGRQGPRRGQVHDRDRRAAQRRRPQRAGPRHTRHPRCRHLVGRAAERVHQFGGAIHRFRQRTVAGGSRQARAAGAVRRHRLLGSARPGCVAAVRCRLVVDHHHRRAPQDRRVHQRLRLRLLLARRPAGVADHRVRQARCGPAHRRGAGHRAGGLRRRHPAPGAGQVSRLQHGVWQPEDASDRCLGRAVTAGVGHGAARRSGRDRRKHFQLGQFRRLGGCRSRTRR